jgi:hypothetical protein
VLSDIVVGAILLIDPCESLEACVGHIFLVQTPGNSLVLEQINDRRDILRDRGKWVTVKTEVVTFVDISKRFIDHVGGTNPPTVAI